MKEQDFLNIIQNQIGTKYIGDDCAYIKEAGIVVTQDNLIENVHFKREWYTPYQLGYKSVAVNISDILASGAIPKYISIGLSLTNDVTKEWVNDFYKGVGDCLYGAEVIGGDITGSKNDISISICAIGSTKNRQISSRKNAKLGHKIIVSGKNFGSSAAGLSLLLTNKSNNNELIMAHLMPQLDFEFSEFIASNITCDYAMMDTSDGLCDALFKIAESSNVTINVDYNKIPHLNNISRELLLYGGEDYKLVASLPENFAINIPNAVIIGNVEIYNGTRLNISGETFNYYDEIAVYNHFGENNE